MVSVYFHAPINRQFADNQSTRFIMALYYISRNGQNIGPLPVDQLMINGLTPQTQVWTEGMSQWMPASQVPELAVLFTNYAQQAYQQPYQQGYQQPFQPNYIANGERPQVGFGDAISICFHKFVDFTGRARRSEYWYFYLFCFLLSTITCGIAGLVTFLPQLSVTVRRFHDTNHSAWWAFLPLVIGLVFMIIFIPIFIAVADGGSSEDTVMGVLIGGYAIFGIIMLVIGIIQLIFLCRDSDRGENKYGPSPKYQ